jgi:predicted dinucleotide-binding enzyme
MRIAIIGAGNVGQAIAGAWANVGHSVVFGLRDPKSAKYKQIPAAQRSTLEGAAAGADAIVLATPWPATEAAVRQLGDLAGKIVIDCTNPLTSGAGGLALALGFETSGAERIASSAKGARVFKTLNQTGAENMAKASDFATKPAMFVAGDDEDGKRRVMQLVGDLGFEPLDAGPLKQARLLEPLAMLWIDQALIRGRGRDFAFALARRG